MARHAAREMDVVQRWFCIVQPIYQRDGSRFAASVGRDMDGESSLSGPHGRHFRGLARAQRNTATIRDVVITVLADDGWGSLTIAEISRRSGLSTFAVRDRARAYGDLAGLAWNATAPVLLRRLQAIVDGHEQLLKNGEGRLLVAAWRSLAGQSLPQDAAAELLAVSNNVVAAAVSVQPDLTSASARWFADLAPMQAAQRAYALALGLGILITNRYPWANGAGIEQALTLRSAALRRVAPPTALPERPASHMASPPPLVPDDPPLDRLLNQTLAVVADVGFDAATVREIAARAGATEGLVFGRYPSKRALVVDAIHRQQTAGYRMNADYLRRIECEHGLAVAEAVFIRESLRPEAARGRAMAIEQHRLAWHDPVLLREAIDRLRDFRAELLLQPGWGQIETEADFYLNVAAPLGALLLPRFLPAATDLPWDVVTGPLIEELTNQPHGPRRRL